MLDYWDASPDLAGSGVGYLLHGLLDLLVDSHFAAVQAPDGAIEDLEDKLFSDVAQDRELQRRSFELRKSLVLLRRVVLPMREVVDTLMRRDLHVVSEQLHPYYQDVYDHVLRATEWTESLRDLVTTILETNLSCRSRRPAAANASPNMAALSSNSAAFTVVSALLRRWATSPRLRSRAWPRAWGRSQQVCRACGLLPSSSRPMRWQAAAGAPASLPGTPAAQDHDR